MIESQTRMYGLEAERQHKRAEKVKREKRMRKEEAAKDRRQKKYEFYVASADPDETWFRHHNWKDKRAKIRGYLIDLCTNEFAMNRWDECGSECLVEYSETEKRHRLRANYCRCRHCEPCAKAKGGLLARNLKARLEAGPKDGCRFRFITLTLKHDRHTELRPQITRLYNCFKALRATKLWKQSQEGGCAILETKWSKTGGWHPHLHVIAEGGWMRAENLMKEWHRITEDSFKADIRELKDIKDTCFYVSKYLGKGCNSEVWDDRQAATEYIASMKGVRFCATFGTWRGFKLLAHDKAHDATDWKPVGLLKNIAANARSGIMADILLIMALEEALQYNPHKKRNNTKCSDPPS